MITTTDLAVFFEIVKMIFRRTPEHDRYGREV